MTSLFDVPQELSEWPLVGHPLEQLTTPVEVDCFERENAAISVLGAENLKMEWLETPRVWGRLIEQADACLEHARLAEKGLRFSAACGLILTAQELLRRSLDIRCSTTEHLTLERAVTERLNSSRRDLDRLLDLSVQVRLFAL